MKHVPGVPSDSKGFLGSRQVIRTRCKRPLQMFQGKPCGQRAVYMNWICSKTKITPMTDPWCCNIYHHWPPKSPSFGAVNIPAPWIRHGNDVQWPCAYSQGEVTHSRLRCSCAVPSRLQVVWKTPPFQTWNVNRFQSKWNQQKKPNSFQQNANWILSYFIFIQT